MTSLLTLGETLQDKGFSLQDRSLQDKQITFLDNLIVNQDFNVLGATTLGDLGVTGQITTGLLTIEGLTNPTDSTTNQMEESGASLATITGTLFLQNQLLSGNLDIFNGQILMTPEGNIEVKGEITAQKFNVEESEPEAASAGKAVLPAGES